MFQNNKVLLYSTGNYMKYPVISHNGKEYEKNIYITESLAIHQKLTQHCKSTVLQLKKNHYVLHSVHCCQSLGMHTYTHFSMYYYCT